MADNMHTSPRYRTLGVLTIAAGLFLSLIFGSGLARAQESDQALAQECKPAYQTCLPNLAGDALDCGDINRAVILKSIGDDPYGLDRDNDGVGCESNGDDILNAGAALARTGLDSSLAVVGAAFIAMGSSFLVASRSVGVLPGPGSEWVASGEDLSWID